MKLQSQSAALALSALAFCLGARLLRRCEPQQGLLRGVLRQLAALCDLPERLSKAARTKTDLLLDADEQGMIFDAVEEVLQALGPNLDKTWYSHRMNVGASAMESLMRICDDPDLRLSVEEAPRAVIAASFYFGRNLLEHYRYSEQAVAAINSAEQHRHLLLAMLSCEDPLDLSSAQASMLESAASGLFEYASPGVGVSAPDLTVPLAWDTAALKLLHKETADS